MEISARLGRNRPRIRTPFLRHGHYERRTQADRRVSLLPVLLQLVRLRASSGRPYAHPRAPRRHRNRTRHDHDHPKQFRGNRNHSRTRRQRTHQPLHSHRADTRLQYRDDHHRTARGTYRKPDRKTGGARAYPLQFLRRIRHRRQLLYSMGRQRSSGLLLLCR